MESVNTEELITDEAIVKNIEAFSEFLIEECTPGQQRAVLQSVTSKVIDHHKKEIESKAKELNEAEMNFKTFQE